MIHANWIASNLKRAREPMTASVRYMLCVVALCAITLAMMRALYVHASGSMFEIHMQPTEWSTQLLGLITLAVVLLLGGRGRRALVGGLVTGAILFGLEVIATYLYYVRWREIPNADGRMQMRYLGVDLCVFINALTGAVVGVAIALCARGFLYFVQPNTDGGLLKPNQGGS
jgi:hypothetical protein